MAGEVKATGISIERLSKIGNVGAGVFAAFLVIVEIVGFDYHWGYLAAYKVSPHSLGIDPVFLLIEGAELTFVAVIEFLTHFWHYIGSLLWYALLIVGYAFLLCVVVASIRLLYEKSKATLIDRSSSVFVNLLGIVGNRLLKWIYYLSLFMAALSLPCYILLTIHIHGESAANKELREFQNCKVSASKCMTIMDKSGKIELVKGFPVVVKKDMVVLFDGQQSIIYRLTDEQVRRPVVAPSP